MSDTEWQLAKTKLKDGQLYYYLMSSKMSE